MVVYLMAADNMERVLYLCTGNFEIHRITRQDWENQGGE